jgi:Secretion system C-terminal sorting domain
MKKILLSALIGFLFYAVSAQSQTIRYVTPSGTGDGSSWAQASNDLQSMINNSVAGDQVWVAAGIYIPVRKASQPDILTPADRDNAFVLKQGVKVYGSFAGTEMALEERAVESVAVAGTGVSILSGDFSNDDIITGANSTLSFTNTTENAYHVVVAAGITSNAGNPEVLLDGFVIKGGNANNLFDPISVNNTSVTRKFGGGIITVEAQVAYKNLLIINNSGKIGAGGMYNLDADVWLTNSALTFNYNTNEHGGGAILNSGSSMVATNVLITNNRAATSSGGILNESESHTVLTNVTIAHNYASNFCGGLYNSATMVASNVIIYGNTRGGTIADTNATNSGTLTYTNSLIQGSGGSTAWVSTFGTDSGNNIDADPLFVAADTTDFTLQIASPAINTGSNTVYNAGQTPDLSAITTDLVANPRISQGVIDMGAFELFVPCNLEVPVLSGQTLCTGSTISDYETTAENLQWYMDETGGEPLNPDTLVTSATYYVSQIVADCESDRTPVLIEAITIDTATSINGNTITAAQQDASYQWMECSGEILTVIDGATNQSFTPAASGSYAVIINRDNCVGTSECVAVNVLSTVQNAINNLKLYPNPADTILNIALNYDAYYSIANVLGSVVKAGSVAPGQNTIDINGLQQGIYLVKIKNNTGEHVMKFVKN